MKSISVKMIVLAIVAFVSSISVKAQDKTSDEAAVRACLENYMSGDGARVEKSFHPSAMMKYIDVQSGEFKDVPIADYIARVKAVTTKTERKIEIVSLNMEGTAAQAKIKIETDKLYLFDFMNLLKINGEWKIVSKIFSRQDK